MSAMEGSVAEMLLTSRKFEDDAEMFTNDLPWGDVKLDGVPMEFEVCGFSYFWERGEKGERAV